MRELYFYHPAIPYNLIEIVETKGDFAYGTKLVTISHTGRKMEVQYGLEYYSDEAGVEIIQFDIDEINKFESVSFENKNRLIVEGIFS